MEKSFHTISEQVALLESHGLVCDETTPDILLREGYYAVINGYRKPFVDQAATLKAGVSIFREGTRFRDIYNLFLFDRDLREITFRYLTRIEALIRNECAYRFGEKHRGMGDYLRATCYTSKKSYLRGADEYDRDLNVLLNTLERASSNDHSYKAGVRHYVKNYGIVPLWVLVGELTFGNIRHLFDLLERDVQIAVCNDIARICHPEVSDERYITPSWLSRALEVLVEARNICAHDDRLYAHTYDSDGKCGYLEMLKLMDRLITPGDAAERDAVISAHANDHLENLDEIRALVGA